MTMLAGQCLHTRMPGLRLHSQTARGAVQPDWAHRHHQVHSVFRHSLRRHGRVLRAQEESVPSPDSSSSDSKQKESVQASTDDSKGIDVSLAPVKPQTAMGKMLSYYLKMEPHLFKAAVEAELTKLREEKDKLAEEQNISVTDSVEVVLYQRMNQLKNRESRMSLEDLMYVSVLDKFMELGVEMMPRLEVIPDSVSTIHALTSGIHSAEALDMVKDHVRTLLGPAEYVPPGTKLQLSKLQAAQVYAASIMFGYFVRRVDKRFQLESRMGLLPEQQEDPVARLERLFSQADQPESVEDPDAASPSPRSSAESGSEQSDASTAGRAESQGADEATSSSPQPPKQGALRRYIDNFDRDALNSMARLVSTEGASLIERQTAALFGDLQRLHKQMQDIVGMNANSREELMQRVQQAVGEGKVEVVHVTVATQRRAVLEAVAFGTFLRDVETHVDTEYALLTPAPVGPRGQSGGGGGLTGVA